MRNCLLLKGKVQRANNSTGVVCHRSDCVGPYIHIRVVIMENLIQIRDVNNAAILGLAVWCVLNNDKSGRYLSIKLNRFKVHQYCLYSLRKTAHSTSMHNSVNTCNSIYQFDVRYWFGHINSAVIELRMWPVGSVEVRWLQTFPFMQSFVISFVWVMWQNSAILRCNQKEHNSKNLVGFRRI